MRISRTQLDQLIALAEAERPRECCGILAGIGMDVSEVFPAANIDGRPDRFLLDPQEQFRILFEIRRRRESVVGVYHSHVRSPAEPSAADIAYADPEALTVIVSLWDQTPLIRAFEIDRGEVAEVAIETPK